MKPDCVRIVSFTCKNFKNIESGKIEFPSAREENPFLDTADILGIYGQNGSGKTAVVDAFLFLKRLLEGKPLPDHAAEFILQTARQAECTFDFALDCGEQRYLLEYMFVLQRLPKEDMVPKDRTKGERSESVFMPAFVSQERISYKRYVDGRWRRRTPLIECDSANEDLPFTPKNLWAQIHADKVQTEVQFGVAKLLAKRSSTSFLFSKEMLGLLKKHLRRENVSQNDAGTAAAGDVVARNVAAAGDETKGVASGRAMAEKATAGGDLAVGGAQKRTGYESLLEVYNLLNALAHYAWENLHVAYSEDMETILTFDSAEDVGALMRGDMLNLLPFFLHGPVPVLVNLQPLVKMQIRNFDRVIHSFIPDMHLEISELGEEMMEFSDEDGGKKPQKAMRIEILSVRGANQIPLRNESRGVKKILSILNLLIAFYQKPSLCVVIDELDAGIFEYLLGELLQILKDNGRGQLLFTSHNLRPLELLEKNNLVFTTTNPERRFIRVKNIAATNNLRDVYLRAINLGGQEKEIYRPTDPFTISRAFRKVGED